MVRPPRDDSRIRGVRRRHVHGLRLDRQRPQRRDPSLERGHLDARWRGNERGVARRRGDGVVPDRTRILAAAVLIGGPRRALVAAVPWSFLDIAHAAVRAPDLDDELSVLGSTLRFRDDQAPLAIGARYRLLVADGNGSAWLVLTEVGQSPLGCRSVPVGARRRRARIRGATLTRGLFSRERARGGACDPRRSSSGGEAAWWSFTRTAATSGPASLPHEVVRRHGVSLDRLHCVRSTKMCYLRSTSAPVTGCATLGG
jgi:hypothetical protein